MMDASDIVFAHSMLDEFGLAVVGYNSYILDENADTLLSFYGKKLVLKREANFKCGYGETEFNPLRNNKLMNMLISRYSNILEDEGIYIKTFYPVYNNTEDGVTKSYTMIIDDSNEENRKIVSNYYYNDNVCLAELITIINGNFRDFEAFDI